MAEKGREHEDTIFKDVTLCSLIGTNISEE